MKNKATRILSLIGLALLVIITGFIREFFFVNVNEQLVYLWYENDVSQMSNLLSFLSGWDYQTLYYSKWFFTLLFSAIFMCETVLVLRYLYHAWYWRELVFIYSLLIAVSGGLFVIFILLGDRESGYLLSRYFMGLAQSPVPLMLMIPAVFLRKRLRGQGS